jgi:hypothetical protein
MPSRSHTLQLYVLLRLLPLIPSMKPSVTAWKSFSWRCRHQHQPRRNIRAFTSETAITVTNLTHTQDRTLGNFLVNGVAFDPPTVPVLLQILSGTKNASELVPAGSIYGLQRNKSVELTIPAVAVGAPVSIRASTIDGPSPFLY